MSGPAAVATPHSLSQGCVLAGQGGFVWWERSDYRFQSSDCQFQSMARPQMACVVSVVQIYVLQGPLPVSPVWMASSFVL